MRITFFGAAREVTGSNILLEGPSGKILLECGLFQGNRHAQERNHEPFQYNPKSISAVIVGHAHLDHTGRLPKFVKAGFRGKIFCTAPTKELTELVLDDSANLMKHDAEEDGVRPIYTRADVAQTMQLFETIGYGEPIEIVNGVTLTFKNAGHILGSALSVLEFGGKKLVYTSDLGNVPSELMLPPDNIDSADYVICETTYGGRIHEDFKSRQEKLNSVIENTIAQNGVLMIPTFAIERTQELLHDIEHFCRTGDCAIPTFYLDSPLAEKVTKVFEKYPEYLNDKLKKTHKSGNYFGIDRLNVTSKVEESKQIENAPNPKVIIAGSGMINGGRILYHLQDFITYPKNTLLIVGYQAQGTLGRRLLEGEKEIKIYGKKYKVGAKVMAIGSYSAHADSAGLMDWVSKISGVKEIFLVHGEAEQQVAFARQVKAKLNLEATIPQAGETYEL
ncbi:MAG: MBL fold metallo-hydrolase [Candidatus Curtissbacteria bacterium]|nr:MBL fold metallo-hydrolase [Candidatus Curtissbacteria bacterium]